MDRAGRGERVPCAACLRLSPPHPRSPRDGAGLRRRRHECRSSGRVARWGQTPWAEASGQCPASTTWQPRAPHLQASSQGMPDLKSCSRRPWPGLNAWHGPSMFSETANASCLALTWSNPTPRTALAFRGLDKEGPIGLAAQAPGSPAFSLAHTCGHWAGGLTTITIPFLCPEGWGLVSSKHTLMALEALPEVLGDTPPPGFIVQPAPSSPCSSTH